MSMIAEEIPVSVYCAGCHALFPSRAPWESFVSMPGTCGPCEELDRIEFEETLEAVPLTN